MDLIFIWIALLGLVILLYVILDGFSLGVALLLMLSRDERDRDLMISSIAPVWDANQTWLVFGGSALFVAFPVIYGILLTAEYIPIYTLIYGLIFRGVSLEFRAHATSRKRIWDFALFAGSLLAIVSQGFILGGILSGTPTEGSRFVGNTFYWFTPFSITIILGLIFGYLLLGSAYLINKTSGMVQTRAYAQAFWSAMLMLIAQIAVTVETPHYYPQVLRNWLTPPRIYFIWMFPAMGITAFYFLIKALRVRHELAPFVLSAVFFLAGYAGLIVSIFPYALPPGITFYDAASQPETMRLMFWGSAVILPIVIGYSIHSYRVFRGKVSTAVYSE